MRFFTRHFEGSRRGFTLLIAVLVSSILVALGSAIFDLVSKEVLLSSSGRESQFAFYAADSGIECALYWDTKDDAFSTSSPATQVSCGGETVDLTKTYDPNPVDNPGHPRETTTFSFSFDGSVSEPCADVKVTKNYYPTASTLESYGHNTCVLTDPLRLERAIRVTY
jgi:hypothetical protein